MPKNIKAQNRHPVDRLADVREQIKALESEEKMLRADIMESGDFTGDTHVANVKDAVRNTLDRPALEAKYGKDVIAGFCKATSYSTLYIFKKAEPRVDVFS